MCCTESQGHCVWGNMCAVQSHRDTVYGGNMCAVQSHRDTVYGETCVLYRVTGTLCMGKDAAMSYRVVSEGESA